MRESFGASPHYALRTGSNPLYPRLFAARVSRNYLSQGRFLARRTLKKAVQQGHRRVEAGGVPSGAHGATNKEHQVCARRRVSEAAGSPLRISMSRERSWKDFSTPC